MNLETKIASFATVENAGGVFSLSFPYISSIGREPEQLFVHVPIKHEEPSESDKKALLEALTVQGGLGKWTENEDGSVWLIPFE